MALGIFVGLTEEELLQYKREALADTGKAVTSYSENGKSVGKAFGMPPEKRLIEINYALSRLDPKRYGGAHTSVQKDWRFRVDQ